VVHDHASHEADIGGRVAGTLPDDLAVSDDAGPFPRRAWLYGRWTGGAGRRAARGNGQEQEQHCGRSQRR
jgi:hypothetical protein